MIVVVMMMMNMLLSRNQNGVELNGFLNVLAKIILEGISVIMATSLSLFR